MTARLLFPVLLLWQLPVSDLRAQASAANLKPLTDANLTIAGVSSAEANGAEQAADVRDPHYRGNGITSSLQSSLSAGGTLFRRMGWRAMAATGGAYYPILHDFLPSGYQTSAGLQMPLGRRMIASVSGQFRYTPNFALTATPFAQTSDTLLSAAPAVDAGVVPPDVDYSVVRRAAYGNTLTVGLTRFLSQTTSLALTYGLARTDFVEDTGPSLHTSNVSARFQQRVTKFLGYHVGYRRRLGHYLDVLAPGSVSPALDPGLPSGDFGSPDPGLSGVDSSGFRSARVDEFDIGLDANDDRGVTVSLTRNTTINFSTGVAFAADVEGRQRLGLTGSANLDRTIGRTNHATLRYDRGTQMLNGFFTPVFTDTFTGALRATLFSRFAGATTLSYTTGEVGIQEVNSRYGTWAGVARLDVPIARRLLFYTEYQYYQHDLGSGVELLSGVLRQQHRTSVRVGVAALLPLVRNQRGGGQVP